MSLGLRLVLALGAATLGCVGGVFASSGRTSLGEALQALRAMPDREYMICVEALDHPGDHRRFLRRAVTRIDNESEPPKSRAVIDWLRENGLQFKRYESLILLVDDELTSVSDNPMDVEVSQLHVRARPDKIIAEMSKASGVGILTGIRAGRFGPVDRLVEFTTEKAETLREVMVKLSLQERLEWIAEVTPVSRTVQPTNADTVLLSSPNGFLTCDIID